MERGFSNSVVWEENACLAKRREKIEKLIRVKLRTGILVNYAGLVWDPAHGPSPWYDKREKEKGGAFWILRRGEMGRAYTFRTLVCFFVDDIHVYHSMTVPRFILFVSSKVELLVGKATVKTKNIWSMIID